MFKKNTAVTGFGIGHFINASTGAAVTTGTPTCKRTIDGTGGACANAASYNSDGAVWEIDLADTDLNGDVIALSFTLTDCLPIAYTIRTTTGIPDASGQFPADVIEFGGTAVTGRDIGASVVAASVTGNVGGNVTGSVNSVATGVTLANDAITAAKFDESTAFPLKSADTGETAVARTGADSDTLETLSDQIDSCYTGTPPTVEQIQSGLAVPGSAMALTSGERTTLKGVLEAAGSHLASILSIATEVVADTNELQAAWVNGGRLDVLIDAIKAKTDNLKASWNDLDAAAIRTALGLATNNLDTQLLALSNYVDCLPETWVVPPAASDWTPTRAGYLDVAVSSRLATSGYTAPSTPPTVEQIQSGLATSSELAAVQTHGDETWATADGFSTHSAADVADAVWNEAYADHDTTGTYGILIGAAFEEV